MISMVLWPLEEVMFFLSSQVLNYAPIYVHSKELLVVPLVTIRISLRKRKSVSVMWRFKLQHNLIRIVILFLLATPISIRIDCREQLVDLPDSLLLKYGTYR